jgi:hypothetical protein
MRNRSGIRLPLKRTRIQETSLTGLGRDMEARMSGRSRSNRRWLRYTDPGGPGAAGRRPTTPLPPVLLRREPPAHRNSMSIAAAYDSARSSTAARRRRPASVRPGRRAAAFAPSPPRIDADVDATATAGGITGSAPVGSCEA